MKGPGCRLSPSNIERPPRRSNRGELMSLHSSVTRTDETGASRRADDHTGGALSDRTRTAAATDSAVGGRAVGGLRSGPAATAGTGRAPAEGGLGTTAKSAATPGQSPEANRLSYRAERYRARSWLSTVSNLKRVRDCGRASINGGGDVGLRLGDHGAGFSGLAHCG